MTRRPLDRRARRPARRRKETSADAAAITPFLSPRPPLSLDAQRYAAFRAGVSPQELAARENVLLSTITRSIETMETERETFSQEQVELANRRTLITAAPAREASLLSMLTATREKLIHEDGDPGRPKYIDQPDHDIQLRAIEALSKLIESIKISSPLVSVSQQNNLQQNFHPGIPGGVSTEQLIRQVREEKGLALPADTATDVYDEPLPDTIDFELQADLAKVAEAEAQAAAEEAEEE